MEAQRADGTRLHGDVAITPADVDDRALFAIQLRADRKAAEAALRDSEANYRNAVELSPQAAWIASADGRQVEFGSRWRAMTGRADSSREEWAAIVHPDDLTMALEDARRAVTTGEPYDSEYRIRMADGNRWFRARAAASRCPGRVLRWYGGFEDVHDRKLAEAALQESERKAREQAALIQRSTPPPRSGWPSAASTDAISRPATGSPHSPGFRPRR